MKSEDMKQKLQFYFETGRKIHISCGDGLFYNGIIIDLNSRKDLFVFLDGKVGEIPILFEEIIKIEPYKEEER